VASRGIIPETAFYATPCHRRLRARNFGRSARRRPTKIEAIPPFGKQGCDRRDHPASILGFTTRPVAAPQAAAASILAISKATGSCEGAAPRGGGRICRSHEPTTSPALLREIHRCSIVFPGAVVSAHSLARYDLDGRSPTAIWRRRRDRRDRKRFLHCHPRTALHPGFCQAPSGRDGALSRTGFMRSKRMVLTARWRITGWRLAGSAGRC